MSRQARNALGAGLVLAVATGALVAGHQYGTFPFVLWLGSLLLVDFALRDGGSRSGTWSRDDLAPLALILGLSAFLRLYRVEALPNGLWLDEVDTVRNALRLGAKPFLPFGLTPLHDEHWVHTSNLYLYYCRLVLAAAGPTRLGIKLISILPGVVAPVLLYALTRRFLSRLAATVAAGLLATSLWHVTLSRWGWDEVFVTSLAIPLFAALWDATEGARRRSYWIAGVLGGLSLYTYLSSRLLVAAALVVLVGRAVWLRRRTQWVGLGQFLLGLALAALPIGIRWIQDPQTFFVRVRQLWYLGRQGGGAAAGLWHSVVARALMFHVAGDANARHNFPGIPMLDPLAGGLFLLGVIVAAIHWRRAESQIGFAWLVVGMLGGVLSDAVEAPQAYRTGLVAPACYLLAGLGFDTLRRLKTAPPRSAGAVPLKMTVGRWSRWLPALCATLVVGLSSVVTFRLYFVARDHDSASWSSTYDGAWSDLVRETADRAMAAGETVLLDKSVRWPPLELEVDELAWGRRAGPRVRWVQAPQLEPRDLDGAVLLVAPSARMPAALRELPSRTIRSPFGQDIAVAIRGTATRHREVSER